MNGHGRGGEESDQQRRQRLTVFRPESAPTLPTVLASNNVSGPLDMSPEASLQGAPSAHDLSTDGMGKYSQVLPDIPININRDLIFSFLSIF